MSSVTTPIRFSSRPRDHLLSNVPVDSRGHEVAAGREESHDHDQGRRIDFLGHKRVAVTGVSRTPGSHGSNVVYKRLRERGYEVFAVNPNAEEVEGDRAYHDLSSIPGGVEAVVIGTRPEIADDTMRECANLGIKHVWMHRGPGGSSVSEVGDGVWPGTRHRT